MFQIVLLNLTVFTGYYIHADASFGTPGDVAVIDFFVNVNADERGGLKFRYIILEQEERQAGRLKVLITMYIYKFCSLNNFSN